MLWGFAAAKGQIPAVKGVIPSQYYVAAPGACVDSEGYRDDEYDDDLTIISQGLPPSKGIPP